MLRRSIIAAMTTAVVCVAAPVAGGASARRVPRAPRLVCGGSGGGAGIFLTFGGRAGRTVDVPVCAHGGVTVSFAGDRATCGSSGLCDDSGTETTSVQGSGVLTLVTPSYGRHARTSTTLVLDGNPTTEMVTGNAGSSCRDTTGDGGGSFVDFAGLSRRGARYTVSLLAAGVSIAGTRCAGPLASDLRGALPTRTLSLRALARGERTIDLSGTRPFTAGGLTGTVRSTVTLTLGRPRHGSPDARPPRGIHLVRERELTLTDHLLRFTGRATATVTTEPPCSSLDACGSTGTIDVAPRPARGGTLELSALAPASRPVAALRAALNLTGAPAPTPRIESFGFADLRSGGAVTAALAQSGGACHDAAAISRVLLEAGATRGGRLAVILLGAATGATDPLRTRCPGPNLGGHFLAAGLVSRAAWRRRTFAVTLGHSSHFTDGPYRVTIHSTLRLVLRRGRLVSRIVRLPM